MNENKFLHTVVIVLCIILAAMIGVLIFLEVNTSANREAGFDVPQPSETESSVEKYTEPVTTEPIVSEQSTEETEDVTSHVPIDLMVSTPYCNLYYPANLKDGVHAEVEKTASGCIVVFYGQLENEDYKLFSVLFAETSDNSFPVGIFTAENTQMDVNVEMFEIPDDENAAVLQEGVNYLLDKLEENPAFSVIGNNSEKEPSDNQMGGEEKPGQSVSNADLVINTPYCDLYYPGQWKDSIRVEKTELEYGCYITVVGIVNNKEAELFTVYFAEAGENSFPVGVLTVDGVAIDVNLEMPELHNDGSWDDLETDQFYSLQEKANYLLDNLRKSAGFVPVDE